MHCGNTFFKSALNFEPSQMEKKIKVRYDSTLTFFISRHLTQSGKKCIKNKKWISFLTDFVFRQIKSLSLI